MGTRKYGHLTGEEEKDIFKLTEFHFKLGDHEFSGTKIIK